MLLVDSLSLYKYKGSTGLSPPPGDSVTTTTANKQLCNINNIFFTFLPSSPPRSSAAQYLFRPLSEHLFSLVMRGGTINQYCIIEGDICGKVRKQETSGSRERGEREREAGVSDRQMKSVPLSSSHQVAVCVCLSVTGSHKLPQ